MKRNNRSQHAEHHQSRPVQNTLGASASHGTTIPQSSTTDTLPAGANPAVAGLSWKPAMVERYQQFTDLVQLQRFSTMYLRKAIRVNTLKITVADLVARLSPDWDLIPVPWCKEGFWITHRAGIRTDIGNLLEHALGYFYVQDPASMLPPLVLQPQPGDRVLDVCAAPGSKTTQMGAMMQNAGVIVANDIGPERLAALGINLQRMGILIAVMTQMRGQHLVGTFDKILLDAPCSATGTFRRSAASLKSWNLDAVHRIANLQRELLQHVWSLLAPGGTLVYSTCSLEPEENEQQVHNFVSTTPDAMVEPIALPIKSQGTLPAWNGITYHPSVKGCLRIFPQDNDTEGFFVAKFKKRTAVD